MWVRMCGGTGCGLDYTVLPFSQRAAVRACNKSSLWLIMAHNKCGLSLSVVSSARWNIRATSSAKSFPSEG